MIPAIQQDEPSFARMVRGRHPVRRGKIIEMSLAFQREAFARKQAAAELASHIDRVVQHLGPCSLPEPATPKPRQVMKRVADQHRMSVDAPLSETRQHHIIAARFDAIVEVYEVCWIRGERITLTELARVFGRDRSSVRNALRKRGVLP